MTKKIHAGYGNAIGDIINLTTGLVLGGSSNGAIQQVIINPPKL